MTASALKAALIAALLAPLAACASGAMPAQMTLASGTVPSALPGAVGYRQMTVGDVQGGSKTNPLWMSSVSNEDFRAALEGSLRNIDYLAPDGSNGPLVVSVSLVDLQQPMMGLDLTVTVKARYTVAPSAGGAPIFDETIAASGTATVGDALIAVQRMRLANEAAVKASIAAFVSRFEATTKR